MPRAHSLKSPSTIFGPDDAAIVNDRRELRRLMPPLEQRGAEMHVIEVQRVVVERDVDALHAAVLAGLPRQVVLNVMPDRKAAQDDVAEERGAEMARRRHHPAHAERGAELGGLAGLQRTGANHFLERDDIGIDRRQHAGDALEPRAAVEAAGAMNVVGGDAHRARALRLVCHQSRSNPRSGLEPVPSSLP